MDLLLVKYEAASVLMKETFSIKKLPKFCESNFSTHQCEFLSLKYTIESVPS